MLPPGIDPGTAKGVPGRLRPRIILTLRRYKCGRSSDIRTDRLYPRRNPWHSFLGAESTPGHMVFFGRNHRKKSPVTPPGMDPGTAKGVSGRLRPRIILTFRRYKGGRSSDVRTGRLYPRRNPWYSFSGAQSTPGHHRESIPGPSG